MRRPVILGGLVAAFLIGAPAAARGPIYAHKAGVTKEALDADETACFTDAQKAMHDPKFRPPYVVNPATQSTAAGSMGSAIGYGLAAGIESGKRFNTTYYDCITSRGYTLRRVSDEDWKALKKVPKAQRLDQMAPWRSAAEPIHPAITRDDID